MSKISRRRTMKEMKERGNWFPFPKWFMNRGYIYFVFLLIGLISASMLFFEVQSSIARMKETPIKQVDYISMEPQELFSEKWAKDFIKKAPEGVTNWKVNDQSTPQNPYSYAECSYLDIPSKNMLNTISAKSDQASVYVQTFQPGTVNGEFENFKKKAGNCWTLEEREETNPTKTTVFYDYGSMFTYGDSIFVVKTTDREISVKITDELIQRAKETLIRSECLSLLSTGEDYVRNLYISGEKYTGWNRNEKVKNSVDLGGVPTVVYPKPYEVKPVEKPEGPWPENFPDLPEKLEKPKSPEVVETKTEFVKNFNYQDPDQQGPGCGWAWHGLEAPNVDIEKLEKEYDQKHETALSEANTDAEEYITSKINESLNMMSYSSAILNWNLYVTNVNNVYERWGWLNNERAKIENSWRRYVQSHNDWIDFDNKKHNALQKYKRADYECSVYTETYTPEPEPDTTIMVPHTPEPTIVEETVTPEPTVVEETIVDEEGNVIDVITVTETPEPVITRREVQPEPTMVPSVVPGRTFEPVTKVGCDNPPSRPRILDQEKPAEPSPPQIPDGVTIPESWPKVRETSRVERVADFREPNSEPSPSGGLTATPEPKNN